MPTVRQRIAFKEVLKGSTITRAMKKANYSPTTASTTGKLTNTKGWKELVDKHISDEKLAKVHAEGLNAKTWYSEGIGKGETQLVEKPDYAVRHRYLESGYKLKGRMTEAKEGNKTLVLIVTGETATRYGINPTEAA